MLYSDIDNSSSPSDNEIYRSEDSENEFSYDHSSDENFSESTVLYSGDSSLLNTSNLERDGIKIWYTIADSYLNKREEMLAEIELQNPDMIVISELFPKTVKSTDINLVEFSIDGFSLVLTRTIDRLERPWS